MGTLLIIGLILWLIVSPGSFLRAVFGLAVCIGFVILIVSGSST